MQTDQANSLVARIVQEQAVIIGPLAWEEAGKVSGLRIDVQSHNIQVDGNPKEVLEKLVAQYERLFGRASREVCRDAIRPLMSQVSADEIPAVLK